MRYVSLLPEWAYLVSEMEELENIAIDIDRDGYYYVE